MQTRFWTRVLSLCLVILFFSSLVFAQDFAQLKRTIEDHLPAELPRNLSNKPPHELVESCKKVIEAVAQVYALPELSAADRVWTLHRETIALIVLAYADEVSYYPRLTLVSDELDKAGSRNLAQEAEKHVLLIGTALATRPNVNFNIRALAERMVLYAEQNPSPESLSFQIIESFLQRTRTMSTSLRQRDRRLAIIAPIFQEFYQSVNHTARARSLEPDIRRTTLVGKEMPLIGVDINGKDLDSLSLKGKVVLLQFWGTWCINCMAEMSLLISLYEKYHEDGFEIIGINTGVQGDDERKVKQFVETKLFEGKTIPWTVLHEGLGKRKNDISVTEFYGIKELPVRILIGRNGKVLELHPLPGTLEDSIAEATSPLAAIIDTLTEEERQQIEEMKKKQQEEEDERIRVGLERM